MPRRLLPWIGLALLAVSFVYFLRVAPPPRPVAQPRPAKHHGVEPLVVVLDPGHGGQDSGAICGAVLEKDLTLDVALRAETLLRSSGFTTLLTRDGDRYLSLAERAAVANGEKRSLFVSIHFNDGDRPAASGVETYFAARPSSASSRLFSWLSFFEPAAKTQPLVAQSESLARFLQEALIAQTHAVNRGIKSEQFYVIAHVRHPAALVEGGFITNPADVMKLNTATYRQQIASAISDGINRYHEVLTPNEPRLALAAPAE